MTDPNQPDQPDAHALLLGNYRLSPDVESSNKPHRVDETKRNPFQRDCGRLLHSEAFRYLSGKTQVFMETAPGYFRSRLTHTMEVVQVARSLSTALGSDLFLCEALALAHDLGHPPFGHDGEAALAECVQKATGEVATFDHNNQTLRVVMHLEGFYPYFRGLNLCVGTLVLLANHGQMHVKKPTPADKKTPHAAAREAWNRLKHEMEQKKMGLARITCVA